MVTWNHKKSWNNFQLKPFASTALLPSPLNSHNLVLIVVTYYYLYYHTLYPLGMVHVLGIQWVRSCTMFLASSGFRLVLCFWHPVGSVLYYVFGIQWVPSCTFLCHVYYFVTVRVHKQKSMKFWTLICNPCS